MVISVKNTITLHLFMNKPVEYAKNMPLSTGKMDIILLYTQQ